MASGTAAPGNRRARLRLSGLVLAPLAVLAALSVFLINGAPLYYWDTMPYFEQGTKALWELGLFRPEATAGADGGVFDADGDNLVNASRAAVYSLLLAVSELAMGLAAMPLINLAVTAVALWLPARVLLRISGYPVSELTAVSAMVLAGSLGALPFYVALLMPDIFTPVLLLGLVTPAVLYPHMHRWELALAFALAGFAVTTHISHLAVAAAFVPAAALVAAVAMGRHWWRPALMALAVVGVGMAERAAFRTVAETVADSEVFYYPYITARLIQDGPGLEFLNENCPDPEIASCLLHEALSWSDDPYRLTASHIIFETSHRLGSYRLMDIEDQARVAAEQSRFFLWVLADRPAATTLALIENTFRQAGMFSAEMTIPSQGAIDSIAEHPAPLAEYLRSGRLKPEEGLFQALDLFHTAVYAITVVALAWLFLPVSRTPAEARLFAAAVILGILANAFVCGAVSQPADRYGARVIWLLPALAVLLALLRAPRDQALGEQSA